MTTKVGVLANLAMDPLLPFDVSSEPYEFVSESLRKTQTMLDTAGIRGTRSRNVNRTRFGPYDVAGSIIMNPSPLDLDLLLPRILGGTEAADSFPLAETLPEFQVLVDRAASHGADGGMQYTACKVSRAIFRASQGGFLELELEIIGKTEVTDIAFPVLTLASADGDKPYVMTDAVLTAVAATRNFESFELIIDNFAEATHHNSITATDIDATDRLITLRADVPWNDANAQALYGDTLEGSTGTLVFTGVSGGIALTFTFAKLQIPDVSPVVGVKSRIPYNTEFIARQDGATKELVCTNVTA